MANLELRLDYQTVKVLHAVLFGMRIAGAVDAVLLPDGAGEPLQLDRYHPESMESVLQARLWRLLENNKGVVDVPVELEGQEVNLLNGKLADGIFLLRASVPRGVTTTDDLEVFANTARAFNIFNHALERKGVSVHPLARNMFDRLD